MPAYPRGLAALLLTVTTLLAAGCGDSVPMTGPDSTKALGQVIGQVVSLYGGLPIKGAFVAIRDGAQAGYTTTTVSDGSFVLKNVKESQISLLVYADGYANNVVSIDAPITLPIGMSPNFTDISIDGHFRADASDPVTDVNERRPVVTHSNGPVTLSVHADCSTAGAITPLYLQLLNSTGTVLSQIVLNSASERDAAVSRVLAPGSYTASFQAAATQVRGGCAFSMTVRAPL